MDTSLTRWSTTLLATGAVLGLLTVAVAALAAHLPDAALAPNGRELLRTAVQMQGWHVTALLACGICLQRRPTAMLRVAGALFLLGIVCFCTGLYALALLPPGPLPTWLGHLAPPGGTLLMLGWLCLAIGFVRSRP